MRKFREKNAKIYGIFLNAKFLQRFIKKDQILRIQDKTHIPQKKDIEELILLEI